MMKKTPIQTQTTFSSDERLDIFVSPHPFAAEKIHHAFTAGKNIENIVKELSLHPAHACAYLNGHFIAQEEWRKTTPKAGTVLTIRMIPMGGGGGKNPLRTVLSLAITAASPVLAGSLTGFAGQASFLGISAGRLITTGVNLLGRLALNAIAPPARPRFSSQKESPTLFLQGARNQLNPFGRVPRVLGKHRFVPPLGAAPYTETIGNDQYLRMLFVWGYGPLQISDLKIGETPLFAFEGVEVENRQGYSGDAPITLYSNSVLQNDLSVVLKNSDGYITRTTERDADEISVDVTLPRGLLKFTSSGKKQATTVQVAVQYSPTGENSWSAGAESFKSISSADSPDILRPAAYQYNGIAYVTKRIDRLVMDQASGALRVIAGTVFREGMDTGSAEPPSVPENLLKIAKIERRSNDTAAIISSRITDERDLTLVGQIFQNSGDFLSSTSGTDNKTSIAAGGLKFPGIVITGKQSAAIRKSISFKVPKGQYDVRVKRLTIDATDDNTFDETVLTALRTVRFTAPVKMTGLAVTALRIKATDQLNGVIDRFNGVVHSILPDWNGSSWVEQVTSNPASLFRHVLQGSANARALSDGRLNLDRIADWHESCANKDREFNAVIDYNTSLREVLQDVAAAGRASPALMDGKWSVVEDQMQTVPVQHFSPRNTYNFQGQKSFDQVPQALRVRFINRNKGWLQDERLVFDDQFTEQTATVYETFELNGITSPDQAWKEGRYHIATARLRPETYSFHCDLEHLVCTRGDLVRFTHDVPLTGLMSARVKSTATSGTDMTAVTLDAEITMEEGKSYAIRFRKNDGTSLVKTVSTSAGSSMTVSFATPFLASDGPAVGDLALFGESGSESIELIVKSIEPQSNLSAKITCVDAAPAVHTADTGAIPDFSSQVTTPPEMQRPPVPVLASVQSGDEVLIARGDGSFTSAIVVTLAPHGFSLPLFPEVKIKTTEETHFHPALFTAGGNQITITDVAPGARYDVKITYQSSSGLFSAPVLIANQYVEGVTALPDDVQNFSLNILNDVAHLSWDKVFDADLSHYKIKFNLATSGATWSNSFDLISQVSRSSTSVSVPAMVGSWLIKAVDQGGRESSAAAAVISTIDRVEGYTNVEVIDESGLAFGGALEGDSANVAFDGADNLVLDDALEGIYYFVYDSPAHLDLGAAYRSLITADMDVTGIYTGNLIDEWTNIDANDDFDGSADPSTWSVQLQLRTTSQDPDDDVWGAWQNFVVGEYIARGFQFRLKLTSTVEGVTPAISLLKINIDMAQLTQSDFDITSSSSDSPMTSVSFPEIFRAYTAISITPHNMESGDYYTISNQDQTGFDIAFYDSTDTRITRIFDYIATGYGREIS